MRQTYADLGQWGNADFERAHAHARCVRGRGGEGVSLRLGVPLYR